jgi:hypothetical protein
VRHRSLRLVGQERLGDALAEFTLRLLGRQGRGGSSRVECMLEFVVPGGQTEQLVGTCRVLNECFDDSFERIVPVLDPIELSERVRNDLAENWIVTRVKDL